MLYHSLNPLYKQFQFVWLCAFAFFEKLHKLVWCDGGGWSLLNSNAWRFALACTCDLLPLFRHCSMKEVITISEIELLLSAWAWPFVRWMHALQWTFVNVHLSERKFAFEYIKIVAIADGILKKINSTRISPWRISQRLPAKEHVFNMIGVHAASHFHFSRTINEAFAINLIYTKSIG